MKTLTALIVCICVVGCNTPVVYPFKYTPDSAYMLKEKDVIIDSFRRQVEIDSIVLAQRTKDYINCMLTRKHDTIYRNKNTNIGTIRGDVKIGN